MAFTTLVLAQLFNCFNARSDRVSAFHGLFKNPLLWAAVAASLALQVAVVTVPFLTRAFHTTPLSLTDWLVCAGLASVVLWANEGKKLLNDSGLRIISADDLTDAAGKVVAAAKKKK